MRDSVVKSGQPMVARLLRPMTERETKERNALTTKGQGLALAAGSLMTVVETLDKGGSFLVEFNKSGKAKKDSCDWMGVLSLNEIEVVDVSQVK